MVVSRSMNLLMLDAHNESKCVTLCHCYL